MVYTDQDNSDAGEKPDNTPDIATPSTPFEEEIFENISLTIHTNERLGRGRLTVKERNIVWKSERDDVDEFNVEFREISLSAIATAPDVCSERACLYLQLDRDDGDEVDNDVYFAVEADEELERLFKSMCDGALRNPDSEEEEEGQSNLFYDMGEVMAGSFDPTVQDDYDDLVGDDPERFENNDEEENT